MKKIFAIFLVFVTFVLLGSTLDQDSLDNYPKTYIVGETYSVNDMYITFNDCIYEENKTTLTFDFDNKLDEERHFSFATNGCENYKSRYIYHSDLSINGDKEIDRHAYKNEGENQREIIYFIKPLEKGTIVITFDERIESTADLTKSYEFYISGFYASSVTFKDTRAYINEFGID